jgi:hypothetical protein
MTMSAFGWLDHDDGERRRMMEVINLFREKGTLDELGIGAVRDTYAEQFFPGTSTIQSRARYFLFIPWLYRQIESERMPSHRADRRARQLQWQLVQSLVAGGEGPSAGVIGIEAGENIQRLPSTIYWQGLRRWGIGLFAGSTERYHASLDRYYREEQAARLSEGGELLDRAHRSWFGSLPPPPANLLTQTTFALTFDEAEFLSERIRRSCGDSLLAACLTPSVTRKHRAHAPWELGGLDSLPIGLRKDIDDARRYSLLMEGAILLYNRMLAELSSERGLTMSQDGVDRYGSALDRWAGEVIGIQQELSSWNRPAFWDRLRFLNPRIRPGAIQFSETWMQRAITGPRTIRDSADVRSLIHNRESRLKGSLARLSNPRMLERWSGESGIGRLTYRWGNAQRILRDILDGLRQPAGTR